MKRSYLFLAEGFEELEALATVDILRRAGADVKTVSIGETKETTGAHGITVVADMLFGDEDMSAAEWLILPGGMPGATNLTAFKPLGDLLLAQYKRSGKIAAICASPAVVLAPLGILDGREATCYPGFESKCGNATMRDTPVMVLDTLITGNGPAAAIRFGLAIAAAVKGETIAQEVGSGMLFYPRCMNLYI